MVVTHVRVGGISRMGLNSSSTYQKDFKLVGRNVLVSILQNAQPLLTYNYPYPQAPNKKIIITFDAMNALKWVKLKKYIHQ